MFDKINWLDIAKISREKSAYDSFAILKQKSHLIDKKEMNDFIFDMVYSLSEEEIESILYHNDMVNELSQMTSGTLFSHKQERNHNQIFLTTLYSLVARKYSVRENISRPKSYKGMDKAIKDCISLTNDFELRHSLFFTYDNGKMLCRNVNALEVLIKMDMVESVKEIGVRLNKDVFCVDDHVKCISSVEMLNLYEEQGQTLWRTNINQIPLWIELYYGITENSSVSEKERELAEHIEKVIPKEEIRKIDVIKYFELWESDAQVESFYKNIEGWKYIQDSKGRNVFMNLLRKGSNHISHYFKEDFFLKQLEHKDNEGANIWRYIFMFSESKRGSIKLPSGLIPYISHRKSKTQLDNRGLGLLAQSGACLSLDRTLNEQKFIKQITQEEWLGNEDGQNIFATQLIDFVLEDNTQNRKYTYLIDYINQYVSIDNITNNLRYALLIFYALRFTQQDKELEVKLINADIMCPLEFESLHNELNNKVASRIIQSRTKEIIDRSAIKSKLLEVALLLKFNKAKQKQEPKSKNRI